MVTVNFLKDEKQKSLLEKFSRCDGRLGGLDQPNDSFNGASLIETGWEIILTDASFMCLCILWCLESIIKVLAAGCQLEKTLRRVFNCELWHQKL